MHIKRVDLFPDKYPTTAYYPFNLEVFHKTHSIPLSSAVSFFVGENGTGKSTLLEAMSYRCQIHIWRGVERRRIEINPYEKGLHEFMDVEWTNGVVPGSFFASETFRHFAESLDEWATADSGVLRYFGGKSLVTQSHGQSLLSFFKARYKIKGLYLLDEPETALSPKSQLGLLRLLQEMSRAGHAQFIVATHSPILLACPGSRIYSFDHGPIKAIGYEETEHFRIYKGFMEDRRGFLKEG